MNRSYDYNGVLVSASRPTKVLKTIKKTFHIDSGDRDTYKYYTNGDFWVYLPRNYQNVVSIRLKDAQFPPLAMTAPSFPIGNVGANNGQYTLNTTQGTGIVIGSTVFVSGASVAANNGRFTVTSVGSTTVTTNNSTSSNSGTMGNMQVVGPGAATHSFNVSGSNGQNIPSATYTADTVLTSSTNYFLISLEGLNKVDETTVNANRSTFSDSFFAKIPAAVTTYGQSTFINYNDHGALENIATYSPPIENLDRLHITTRLHSQQDKSGFLYWTTDGAVAAAGGAGTNVGTVADFNLTFEIEYLDNSFTDFSSFESHLRE